MKNIIKLQNKKVRIIMFSIIIFLLILLCIFTFKPRGLLNTIINQIQNEEAYSLTYQIKAYDKAKDIYSILVIVTNPDGIEKIKCIEDGREVNCYGKKRVGLDYKAKDITTYNFEILLSNNQLKNETVVFERERKGKDSYRKVKGVYVDIPSLEGFNENYTRYISVSDNGVLQPGNWINDEEPEQWYDYKNKQWANIYTENNGVEGYYVWIPRYAYKLVDNERVDVKFIDVYNNYKDADTEEVTTWQELEANNYKIPEAFETGDNGTISIPGYWMSKYELSDLTNYTINYELVASQQEMNVTGITTNTTKTIASYTYAINGKIKNTSPTASNYSFTEFDVNENNVINVTALDSDGRIVGSMTKILEPVDVNEPDLTGFNKDTTFYVYWDNEGVEHSDISLNDEPPANWYNYTYKRWANIVTKNNGTESYFVWIPRYQYLLDTTTQRVSVKFIKGLSTGTETGYQIPEAFTFNGKQLYGYWISKYELKDL